MTANTDGKRPEETPPPDAVAVRSGEAETGPLIFSHEGRAIVTVTPAGRSKFIPGAPPAGSKQTGD